MKRAALVAKVRELAAPQVEKLTDAIAELLVDHGMKAIDAARTHAVTQLRAALEGKHAETDRLAASEARRRRIPRAKRRRVQQERVEQPAVAARTRRRDADAADADDVDVKVERRASSGPTCGNCGEAGHNKRTCKSAPAPVAPTEDDEKDEDNEGHEDLLEKDDEQATAADEGEGKDDDEEDEEPASSTPVEVKPPPYPAGANGSPRSGVKQQSARSVVRLPPRSAASARLPSFDVEADRREEWADLSILTVLKKAK